VPFWDSSALLPLVIEQQPFSRLCRQALRRPGLHAVAFVARVECRSAIERLARDGALAAGARSRAIRSLDALLAGFDRVTFSAYVEEIAVELLARRGLRSLDALQLACALALGAAGSKERPALVCCDLRLTRAAAAEGLRLVIRQA
jgi:predicted nucleic acid-binding protein